MAVFKLDLNVYHDNINNGFASHVKQAPPENIPSPPNKNTIIESAQLEVVQ